MQGCTDSIPGQGTRIPHAMHQGQKKQGGGGVNSPLIYLIYMLMVNTHASFSSILDQVVYTDYFRPNNRDTPLVWVTSGSQGTLGGGEGWLCS